MNYKDIDVFMGRCPKPHSLFEKKSAVVGMHRQANSGIVVLNFKLYTPTA
jgi:hypothetical protein